MPYAAQTKVSIAQSKTDIEALLARYGATGFGYVTEGDRAMVAFNMEGRRVQLMLAMPSIDDFALTRGNSRRTRPLGIRRGSRPAAAGGARCC